jgi:4a-hydroxytetrahydrobiopterin dehydratase
MSSSLDGDTDADCVACREDAPTATDAEIAEFHPQVLDWEIVELGGIKLLRPVFSLDDLAHALEFTRKVGKLAEDPSMPDGSLTLDYLLKRSVVTTANR